MFTRLFRRRRPGSYAVAPAVDFTDHRIAAALMIFGRG